MNCGAGPASKYSWRLPESEAYCELNFSPSGEWAMYGFVGYRRGMAPMEVRRPPRIAVRPMPRGLILEAITYLTSCRCRNLARPCARARRLSSRKRTGHLTYWALTHPSAQPDFHHRLGFALEIGKTPAGVADVLLQAVGKPAT